MSKLIGLRMAAIAAVIARTGFEEARVESRLKQLAKIYQWKSVFLLLGIGLPLINKIKIKNKFPTL